MGGQDPDKSAVGKNRRRLYGRTIRRHHHLQRRRPAENGAVANIFDHNPLETRQRRAASRVTALNNIEEIEEISTESNACRDPEGPAGWLENLDVPHLGARRRDSSGDDSPQPSPAIRAVAVQTRRQRKHLGGSCRRFGYYLRAGVQIGSDFT